MASPVKDSVKRTSITDLYNKDLHPDNFPNIQAAHAFHNLIKDLYPLVENAASLAGIKMDMLLDGTPFDWDAKFAAHSGKKADKRGFSDIVALMAEVSRIMLNFIGRAAEYAHQPIISNIADTLADALA